MRRLPHAAARTGLITIAGTTAGAAAIALYARAVWPWFLLGWVWLVPWLAALDRIKSVRGAVAAGLLMCAAFAVAVFPWFPDAIGSYTGASWLIGAGTLMVLAPALEPQLLTLAVARALAQRGPRPTWWRTALVGAGVYVGTEWAFPKPLADTLGQGLFGAVRVRQAADLFGTHGLTFFLILSNECLLAALRALADRGGLARGSTLQPQGAIRPRTGPLAAPLICLALLVAAPLVYGTVRIAQLRHLAAEKPVTAALIQANMSHYDRLKDQLGSFEAVRRILEAHWSLSTEVLQERTLDLLVWPETIYPTTFGAPKSADGAGFDRAIAAFVKETQVPLLFGAYDAEGADEFNAAILLATDQAGRATFDVYRKARLFPFTEYLPPLLESARVRRWLPWAGTWKPGTGPRVLSVTLRDQRILRIAPLICYDAVDPGLVVAAVRDGAELLVTLSNDSWFAFPGVQRLILIVSAFRSIETRRPQLRATATGISAAIDVTGTLLETIDVDGRGALVTAITPIPAASTLLLAWGNWLPPTALSAALAFLVSAWMPPRTR